MTESGRSSSDDENDRSGYRRPPKATRFTKGRSGNPAGRPPGRHREAPYEAVLGQMVTIREGGVERRVTGAEAFLCSNSPNVASKETALRRAHRLLSSKRPESGKTPWKLNHHLGRRSAGQRYIST